VAGKKKGEKVDKREAILRAALELFAEQGFQNTPMSLISKRSKASAGIIYHYFESKENLLASLYGRIREDMGKAIVAADDPQQPLVKRFQLVWLSSFHYCLEHPQEIIFLEQFESVPMAQPQEPWLVDGSLTLDDFLGDLHTQNLTGELPPDAMTLYGLIAELRQKDLIKDLPLLAIRDFTVGVAHRLARQAASGRMSLDDSTLKTIARACWDALAR
jgi:TetR/AcrR family transcriptional regulator, repressor of fatR-cypB operon